MIVTVDTNVIFASLYSKLGASHKILNLIIDEQISLAMTNQVYFEYYDVLTRKAINRTLPISHGEVEDIIDLLTLLARKHIVYYLLRPNLIDESDNIFVECAFTSNSEYLITSNVKHFEKGELHDLGFKVITPAEFLKIWRQEHG